MTLDLEKLLAPIADIPGQPVHVGSRILRSALDHPPDRYLAVAVGKRLGDWTTLGPFVGWRVEDVEADALAAARDCADVRLVGPVRADALRRMLFGGDAVTARPAFAPAAPTAPSARATLDDARRRLERSGTIAADLRAMALRLRASAARIRNQCPEVNAADRSLLEANAVALEASAEMLLATSGNLERGAPRGGAAPAVRSC